MAQQSDQIFGKLLELKHRIEFLRNSVDPDMLIGAIERELCEFTEFQCTFKKYQHDWDYYIRTSIQHSIDYIHNGYSTKLDALYAALADLTRG